ncbi:MULTISPECIES: aspartate aminotransferase family protein [unclassified Psychrobacter]|uniref:aspartate aminotransferase family protein n=1 Tax=unclassified Psychrobacter TaxID=196806 RepID=UPI00188ACFEA|nr:aspartate aminotransferase family protein [Psychrobacter sp. N25K4-3-2]MBF4488409.1 aspartate aminotransferase family protein [Psychrobacter sp. N25K4-3-2]
MSATYLMPTYNRQPISFTRGSGSWLYTKEDTPYLDALTGIAVCGLGHCHPQVTDAIQQQAGTLVHTSNLFGIDWQERAGEVLCTAAQMDSVFFANSGAEANEAALKMARLYAYKQGFKRPKVIVMEQSFHGRTLLSLSATANPKAREGFYTLDDDFIRVPFGDIAAVKQAAQAHDDICAIFVEPIQGEGGLNTAPNGFTYLEELQAECDAHNWLFMLDEVQTGNGRTGKYFAYQHSNARPDVLTTAKGLGNGFPVGACMVRGRANGLFGAGSHGSTYGGTPLASRVVHSVYEVLANSNIMENAVTEGLFIRESIVDTLGQYGVSSRGAGMMIGIALPEELDCSKLVDRARDEQNLIINVTGGHVVRLLPPLNISRDESTQVADRLIDLLKPSF